MRSVGARPAQRWSSVPGVRGCSQSELFSRWQTRGDTDARDKLFEQFLPLARRLALRYLGAREPFDDLLQVAGYGLLKALDRFDPRRGTSFSTFAVPTILGELKRYFRDLGWSAHVPRGAQELALSVQSAQEAFTGRTGRSPTVYELASDMDLTVEVVLGGLEAGAAHHSTSLDAPVDTGEDGACLGASFGALDDGFQLAEHRATLAAGMDALAERDRRVLALRFIKDMTQTEIAREVGVSQMQVSRILRRAIASLNAEATD